MLYFILDISASCGPLLALAISATFLIVLTSSSNILVYCNFSWS